LIVDDPPFHPHAGQRTHTKSGPARWKLPWWTTAPPSQIRHGPVHQNAFYAARMRQFGFGSTTALVIHRRNYGVPPTHAGAIFSPSEVRRSRYRSMSVRTETSGHQKTIN
jgi:hypothetical protein